MAWRLVFILSLVVVMAMALMPADGSGWFPGQDKLMHAATFAILFLVGQKSLPNSPVMWQLHFILIVYGIVMELLQGQTGYRYMEAWDLVADLCGQLLGHLALFLHAKKIFKTVP